ncbi:ADP-ribosylglycohydrolase family protein, partial [Thioalkalivibrio sp.]|uniref:ADP-ribosylglycohydrolase family protein n=1 Tax=Thioalkalivibrio sp. TaxID=2093813 RepID=UPI00397473C9
MVMSPDGDSDSSGSVTGNLLGKLYGVDAIPQTWLEPLGLRNAIMEIAETRTTSPSF